MHLKQMFHWLVSEEGSRLAPFFMALTALFGLFNVRSWVKQAKVNKRAELSAEALNEIAHFYAQLEELIECQFQLPWQEWGSIFRKEYRESFLDAKLKARRLNISEIDDLLEKMEESIKVMPFLQKLCTPDDIAGEVSEKAVKEFKEHWKQFQRHWERLNATLSKIGLYKD